MGREKCLVYTLEAKAKKKNKTKTKPSKTIGQNVKCVVISTWSSKNSSHQINGITRHP